MNLYEFQTKALRTYNPLYSDLPQMTLLTLDNVHFAMGVSGEVGEIVSCLAKEKHDKVNLKEEIGDTYWFLVVMAFRNDFELSIPEDKETYISFISQFDCLESALVVASANLLDIVKKNFAYNKPYNKEGIKFWCSTVHAILSEMALLFDIELSDVFLKNYQKLFNRYPERYTDYHATNRDLIKERKDLEGSGN